VFRTITITLLVFVGCSLYLHAQPPQIRATLDKKEALIGDHIRLQLQADYGTNLSLQFPIFGKRLDSLEVLEVQSKDSTIANNQIHATQNILLTVFDTGFYKLPPLVFTYKGPNSLFSQITTDTLYLIVKAPVVDQQGDIKPIANIIEPPKTWLDYLPYALLITVLLSILSGFVWWKRRPKIIAEPNLPPTPLLPPHTLAQQQLLHLDQKQWWQQGKVKQYYTDLSNILRQYIEARYQKPAMEQTTDEILQSLDAQLSNNELQNLKDTLLVADMVKFAKATPTVEQHIAALQNAQQFVKDTQQTELEEITPTQ